MIGVYSNWRLETLDTGRSLSHKALSELIEFVEFVSLVTNCEFPALLQSHFPLKCCQGRFRHVNIFNAESHFSGFFFFPTGLWFKCTIFEYHLQTTLSCIQLDMTRNTSPLPPIFKAPA
jgi:hypothetical protein